MRSASSGRKQTAIVTRCGFFVVTERGNEMSRARPSVDSLNPEVSCLFKRLLESSAVASIFDTGTATVFESSSVATLGYKVSMTLVKHTC